MFTGDSVCSFFSLFETFAIRVMLVDWNFIWTHHLVLKTVPCALEKRNMVLLLSVIFIWYRILCCFLIYPLSEFLSIADSGVLKSTTEVSSNSVSFVLCVCIACYLYKHLLLLHFLADLTFYQQVSTVSCCLFLLKSFWMLSIFCLILR